MASNRVLTPTLLVAAVVICGWSIAFTSEPPPPSATAEVQDALDEAVRLRSDRTCEAALEESGQALQLAEERRDDTGRALAHRLRAQCLMVMCRWGDATDAWRKSSKAWKAVGYGPGQAEALAQASHLYCVNCSQESSNLVTRAIRIATSETERPLAAADALHEAGRAAQSRGRSSIAYRLFAGAVEIREAHAPNTILLAESLVGLGGAAKPDPGKASEAHAVLIRARDIAEAVEPAGPTTADALFQLAHLAWVYDDFDESVRYGLEAVRVREHLSPDTSELAGYLTALADSEIMLGDLEAARMHHLQALKIWERPHPNGRELIAPLTGLGFVSLYSGELDAAQGYFARAVELKKAHGEDPVDLACSLLNMGLVPADRQDFAAARRCFKQVVELLDEHAPDHPNRAKAISNLAEMAFRQGDERAAVEYARQALPLFEESMPGSIDHSMALTRMGMAASSEGDVTAAMDYHKRALTIRKRHLPDSDLVAESLLFMTSELIDSGELTRAERYGRQAFAIVRNETANMTAAQVATKLGLIERENGNLAEAEELFEFSLRNWSNYGGTEHAELAAVYTHLAGLYALQDLRHQAIGSALRSEAIHRKHVRRTARSLPEREALEYGWSTCDGVLSLADAYADSVSEAPRLALDAVVRSRAIVLDEVAARNRLIATTDDPEIARLAADLTSARERLAMLTIRGVAADDAEAYRTALMAAIEERQRAEDELAFSSREYQAERDRRAVGLEEVVSRLPEDSALVAYVRYNRFATGSITFGWGTSAGSAVPSYAAFVARKNSSKVIMVSLGEAADIDRLVADLRDQIDTIATAPGRSSGRAERSFRVAGAELRTRVWDPIALHLNGVERIIVVPDGSLHLFNLSSLPVGESHYLAETGPRFHHVSAERDLVRWDGEAEGRGLLVLGSPAYDDPRLFAALRRRDVEAPINAVALVPGQPIYRSDRSTCAGFSSMRFEELPSSGREVDDIAELWRHAVGSSGQSGGNPGHDPNLLVLTGAEASESSLKIMAADREVLHLATHGFFLGRPCLPDSGTADPLGSSLEQPIAMENPLLLAGLALAGANHRDAAGPDEDDGVLTAEEIAALDLGGVGWAVLSACNTGVGEVSAGEGVFGLRRAFQVAGVRTLIISLWQVEDEASRAWMRELYENRLARGQTTIDSVYEASLTLLERRREAGLNTHPFYWAGFIASGDWR